MVSVHVVFVLAVQAVVLVLCVADYAVFAAFEAGYHCHCPVPPLIKPVYMSCVKICIWRRVSSL